MKKKLCMAVVLFITVMVACGKPQITDNTETTCTMSVETDTLTKEDTAVTETMETTTDRNIMPNTAGIIVAAEVETEAVKVKTEKVIDERRGINSAASNVVVSADEDMERLGVSKKVVFECHELSTYRMDAAVLSRFNELLVKEYGCDYVMELVGIGAEAPPGGYTYMDKISDMRSLGQHVDIITAMAPARYSRLVSEGYLEDITDYLKNDENGQKFYDSYPEEIWNMVTIDDRIYGYTTYSTPLYMYSLSCNKEMAEKFGLKVKENFTFYDIGEILGQAELTEEELKNIVPVFAGGGYLYRMLDSSDLSSGIFARKDAEGKWTAFNPTEDEEFIKLWKTVREYRENGWLDNSRTANTLMYEGQFIFACNNHMDAEMVDDNVVLINSNNKEKVYEIIPGDVKYAYYGPRDSIVYGITTWSEYKEEAIELITLIQTEPELCNLLRYGFENVHYVYADNKVVQLMTDEWRWGTDSGTFSLVNPNLTYPVGLEPENKLEFYKERCANYEKDLRLDCSMTVPEFPEMFEPFEQMYILEQIYKQGYTKLINGEYEDVEAAVAEIHRMQKEAGIDEVIDALNERFRQ